MTSTIIPIRVVVADRSLICREILRKPAECEDGLQILGEASDIRTAVRLTRQLKPDILLLDFDLCQKLERHNSTVFENILSPARIVVIVPAIEKPHILEAFRLGAHGVVLTSSPAAVVVQKMHSVMNGQYWLETESVGILVQELRDVLRNGNGTSLKEKYGLTRRELEIMAKIACGLSNKEVGEEFHISERTVKHHLTNIFSKVRVSNRLQLALFAVSHGLVSNVRTSMSARLANGADDAQETACSSKHRPLRRLHAQLDR